MKCYRCLKGFTLLEIMMTVVIIGLLVTMAIPAFKRNTVSSQNTRLINDYRIFNEAFKRYSLENGVYPKKAGGGKIPQGMSGYLPSTWTMESPVGGQWIWIKDNKTIAVGVSLRKPNIGDEQMLLIDEQIDDGDLATGTFLKTKKDEYTFLIEGSDIKFKAKPPK